MQFRGRSQNRRRDPAGPRQRARRPDPEGPGRADEGCPGHGNGEQRARRRGQWAGAQGRRARGGRAVETGAGGARDSFLQDPGEGKAGAAGSGSFLYGAVSVSNDAECPWRACGGFATSVQFCIRILNRVDDGQGWRQREPVVITLTEGPPKPYEGPERLAFWSSGCGHHGLISENVESQLLRRSYRLFIPLGSSSEAAHRTNGGVGRASHCARSCASSLRSYAGPSGEHAGRSQSAGLDPTLPAVVLASLGTSLFWGLSTHSFCIVFSSVLTVAKLRSMAQSC